ncbi:MAG: CAP domain-containing protein [Waltera sp.]
MAIDALDIVNAKRAENGLATLNWSNGLESCAMVRATEAASKFSHTRPNGKDWYTVNSELMWGENLAKGYDSAQSVVDAWMASPTHAANILADDFTTCSIAVYETNGKLYFAQEFGY